MLIRVRATIVAGWLTVASASAAQFEVVRKELFDLPSGDSVELEVGSPPGCNVRLSGPIEAGDLARLQAAYAKAAEGRKYNPSFLCLDSPGGAYSEATAMARWLLARLEHQGRQISTVVMDGATCASACALIFMTGSMWQHLAHLPNRWLHAKGRLGFHAPFLEKGAIRETNFSREDVIATFVAAQRSMTTLMSEFATVRRDHDGSPFPKPWVRMSLVQEFMTRGPNDLLWVDTVDQAGRWEISVFGKRTPKRRVTQPDASIACQNAIAWYGDRSSAELYSPKNPDHAYEQVTPQEAPRDAQGREVFAFWTNSRAIATCVVNGGWQGGTASFMRGEYDANKDPLESYTSEVLFYPAATKLSHLGSGGASTVPVRVTPQRPTNPSSPKVSPSFHCDSHTAPAEATVCENPLLAQLDIELARFYSAALVRLSGVQRETLVRQQREWIRQRDGCMRDVDCLRGTYERQIIVLKSQR